MFHNPQIFGTTAIGKTSPRSSGRAGISTMVAPLAINDYTLGRRRAESLSKIDDLTSQPSFPKLRHIRYMHRDLPQIRILAVLLAIIFLGAQFHFCADLNAGPASSHICPVCNAASSAVSTPALLIALVSISDRLENRGYSLTVSTHIPRAVSPRAPPSFASIS